MAAAKKNKIKYNLKNVHAAKLTVGEDGSFTYETPKAIPGLLLESLSGDWFCACTGSL